MGLCISLHNIEKEPPQNSKTENSSLKHLNQQNNTLRYTNLIKKYDLGKELKTVEDYLFSDKYASNEKLRKTLNYLKERTIIDEENSSESEKESYYKGFIKLFLAPIERYFEKLYDIFEASNKQGYRPTIKILQIVDLMIQTFQETEQRKERDSIISHVYSIIERKIGKTSDWRILRKLYEQTKEIQEIQEKLKAEEKLIDCFKNRLKIIKNALLWKKESESIELVAKIIEILEIKINKDPENFEKCLIKGRFDKIEENILMGSLIVGDEGGVYLLMNSFARNSLEDNILLNSGLSKEFLEEKRMKDNKVILGKGAFGKVRLALSVFGDENVDIGQLVCVKKSNKLTRGKTTLSDITESAFDDFLLKKLDSSIHTPKALDMAIVANDLMSNKNHKKSYFFMEIVPQNTADKVFSQPEYQKWEYQQPYILAVLRTMKSLLMDHLILNTDLKPENTLFDIYSRKMSLIDYGSSIMFENKAELEKFDASIGGFGLTILYCPPETIGLLEASNKNKVEDIIPTKVLTYLCGATIAKIASESQDKKISIKNWKKKGEKIDLNGNSKTEFLMLLEKMLDKNPIKRINIDEAIKSFEKIGSSQNLKAAALKHYIDKVRFLIENDPSALNFNSDINSTKYINQYVTKNNPQLYKGQKTESLEAQFFNFLDYENPNKVMVLFGDAGSGKSLSLQLLFIEHVRAWTTEDPIPIFFNMADEIHIDKVFERINNNLLCNLQLADMNQVYFFIDSFDEGPWDDKTLGNELEQKKILEEYKSILKGDHKMIITCRTDFVESKRDDILTKLSPEINFIAPIDYEYESQNDTKFEDIVNEWLKQNEFQKSLQNIKLKLLKSGLKEKMKTGLMFNMILNMVFRMKEEELIKYDRIRSYEIYDYAIRQEINNNWNHIIGNETKKQSDEKLELLIQEVKFLFGKNEYTDTMLLEKKKEIIIDGMLRIGECIAVEMIITNTNRLNLIEIKNLIYQKFYESSPIEWNTLYKILRIMGLKMEERKYPNDSEIKTKTVEVGFRHETYKNYFLLRGLKRALKIRMPNRFGIAYQIKEKLINSVLGQKKF